MIAYNNNIEYFQVESKRLTSVSDLYSKFSQLRLQYGFLFPAEHVTFFILHQSISYPLFHAYILSSATYCHRHSTTTTATQ